MPIRSAALEYERARADAGSADERTAFGGRRDLVILGRRQVRLLLAVAGGTAVLTFSLLAVLVALVR